MTWVTIAIESEAAAWAARGAALEASNPADHLSSEHKPSLVGLAAASHALDGLYGNLRDVIGVPQTTRRAWDRNRTPRHAIILETLKRGFHIGKAQNEWAKRFEWLFDARDFALHHPAGVH